MVGLGNDSPSQRNDPVFKTVGLALAISSGVFIGVSFVLKKKGLLAANEFAGKGYAYLSNGLWWSGMILMIIGEICNFVAYALTQAILVTPLGALSVVVSAVCSSIFLKERLNMQGKIGCAQCIIGATIIVMHAPAQRSAIDIDEFQALCFSPGFLTYAIVCIISSGLIIWRLGPTYGSKNMLVYISVCSIIGSLSVVTTQGLGIAIIRTIQGDNQFAITHWFLYFLIAFIIVTLLTEINFLNKALNLFNTAMVTPVYYVIFTSLTILSSSILTQGFQAPPASVVTVILGFLVICSGIVLLQTSKGISVDTSGTTVLTTVSKDSDLESGSTLNNKNSLLLRVSFIEPGASEIRASFGSIKRYSMNFDPQHKDFATFPYDQSTSKISPNVKKTIRLGHQTKRSMSMPDPTILNEFIEKTEEDEKKSYGLRSFTRKLKLLSPTTPTTPFPTTSAMPTTTASFSSSVNRKEKIGSKKVIAPIITTTPPTTSVDYHRQYSPSLPTRPSSSLSPPSSPSPSSPPLNQQSRSRPQSQSQTINNDNNNEIDIDNNNHHQQQHNHHIDILSLPSPLQHPINYIRQHLSPTNTSFIDNGSSSRRIDPKTL